MNQDSPDQVSLLGETLEEWMQENSVSVDQLSDRSGLSPEGIHSLINGGLSIDRKRAEALQNGTGVPGLINSGLRSSFGAIKDWNTGVLVQTLYDSVAVVLRGDQGLEPN